MNYAWGLAAAFLALSNANALCADEAGRLEYEIYCSQCHGALGQGDGEIAPLLAIPVADLTRLAAQNGGTFPQNRVVEIIDGRGGIRAHGAPMPLWGTRFQAEVIPEAQTQRAELIAETRILSLARYLETLQQ